MSPAWRDHEIGPGARRASLVGGSSDTHARTLGLRFIRAQMDGAQRVPKVETAHGVLVEFPAGTGVRPAEGFGAEWRDIDLKAQIPTVQRAYAKRRLKDHGRTDRSRRAVLQHDRVVEALEPPASA